MISFYLMPLLSQAEPTMARSTLEGRHPASMDHRTRSLAEAPRVREPLMRWDGAPPPPDSVSFGSRGAPLPSHVFDRSRAFADPGRDASGLRNPASLRRNAV